MRGIDASLQRLIDEMVETMRDAHGVGLAANQIGVPLRLCVIEISEEEEVRVLINPELIARRGEREIEEGCLSIPGYRGLVRRSQEVRVRALDREGQPVRFKAEDNLLAQALEHEIGHLNGQLYIDHLVRKDAIWKLGEKEPDEEQSSPDSNPSPARMGASLPASS